MTAPTMDGAAVRVDFGDRSSRRRRRWRAAGILLVIAGIAGAVWLIMFSAVLAVQDVRVVGADGVQAQQVLDAAAVPVGRPLARVDAAQAEAAVLALPWVASAEVRRGWPHEVVVAVMPRVPIALLGGSTMAVDATGATFAVVGIAPTGLPTVTATGAGLQTAMTVLASLPADLAARVVGLAATTRDDVDLTLRGGALVHWGSAEQPEFKAEVLGALMRRKQQVYDVTAPELPTTFKGN